ncbi:histidine-specific methyltransferase [Aspergillus flavus]|uniref:Histidine-specific methyltransferase n=2 Tax=Aspergillus subgen. Circumdati TaxID=2720871 RepID=A0A5N6H700_ASPFL|nr:hypothetical protein Ao3042_02577 [Aspergillus oryzae 3.042]KAB8249439.1 histidine-specific methyltransferase [Aspergillus flavus]KDE83350.1 hypothetical protein AO1008_09828 [Aspergillus oryzae 100-8]|eukprot:EIT80983.1 hypothetical protein Ao3042_02577 [Aspergillus oryzae 3.042]
MMTEAQGPVVSIGSATVTYDHPPIISPVSYPKARPTQILDIRKRTSRIDLYHEILAGLRAKDKELPSLLLWNDRGLDLFSEILNSDEYYPRRRETQLLQTHVNEFTRSISSGERLIELGAGNLQKTVSVLRCLEQSRKHVEYCALDVSHAALQASITELKAQLPFASYVTIRGLLGTYNDCASWLKQSGATVRTTFLWLGNSIANFEPEDATSILADFLQTKVSPSHSPQMIIAVDGCQDVEQILEAYDMPNKLSQKFVFNGLSHANQILGSEVFRPQHWTFEGKWNPVKSMHESFYVAKKPMSLDIGNERFHVHAGEKIRAITSGKWPKDKVTSICQSAGIKVLKGWTDEEGSYGLYLLCQDQLQVQL